MPTNHHSYLSLLKLPGAPGLLIWGSLARLMYGVLPMALLLLLVERRHSFAQAGAALAAFGLTAGLLGPARARLADRYGPRLALAVMGCALVAALASVILAAGAPLAILIPLAMVAGAAPPPVGPLVRTGWRSLTGGAEDGLLARAYALDVVGEDLLFLVGPLVAAPCVAWLGAGPVVMASSATLLIAATAMATRLPVAVPERLRECAATVPHPSLWRNWSFLLGLGPIVGLGLLLGALGIAAVAVVLSAAGTALAGVPDAVIAAGSVTSGLIFGRRRWPGSSRQQARALVGMAAALAFLAALLTKAPGVMLLVLAGVGCCVAPIMVCSYLIADGSAPAVGAEATSWVNSALNVSLAAGTAAAGVLVGAWSAGVAMAAAAAAAVLVVGVAEIGRSMLPAPAAGDGPSPPGAGPRTDRAAQPAVAVGGACDAAERSATA
ncbi:MAG: MFS transporter [Candidatus Dormibacteria bacterium]